MALTGYPARDLLLQPGFIARAARGRRPSSPPSSPAPRRCSSACPMPNPSHAGRPLFNAAALLRGGARRARLRQERCCRPTTSSTRIATSSRGTALRCSTSAGGAPRVSICEDVWNDRDFWQRPRYHRDPIDERAARSAPTCCSTCRRRRSRSASRPCARRCSAAWRASHGVPVVYVNQVGGNDDLVFDGRSVVLDARRRASSRAAAGVAPSGRASSTSTTPARRRRWRARRRAGEEEIFRALVLGTARLRAQVRLPRRAARPVGRHRLGADRRRSPPRRSAATRARRADAVAVSRAAAASTIRSRSPSASASAR